MEQSHCLRFFQGFWPPAARASQTFSDPVGGALIYTAIYYDCTVRFVGDDHRNRTNVAGRLRFSRRAPETTRRHWISTWISNPTQNLATSLRLFGGRLRLIGGHRRSSEIVSGMPKWVKNRASNLKILSSKLGTATGVAMPKKSATTRRRPEGASDGCKIVRSVSRFC